MSATLIHDLTPDVSTTVTPAAPAPPPVGVARRRRATIAVTLAGALLVALLVGFCLGRATAPDPFARLLEMRPGVVGAGTSTRVPSADAPADGAGAGSQVADAVHAGAERSR